MENINSLFYGGDIHENGALRHILSIGYELETSGITKLTKTNILEIDRPKQKGVKRTVLFNTDSSTKTINLFKSPDFEPDEDDQEMINRLEETFEDPKVLQTTRAGDKTHFYITNDLGDTSLGTVLALECTKNEDKFQKNQLYRFRSEDKKHEFPIQFVYHTESECGSFSNVEWHFTFLQPEQSNNIILITLMKLAEILIRHLKGMKKIQGNLLLKTGDDTEKIVGKPNKRSLFHKRGTNVYYMQTHYFENISSKNNVDYDREREITLEDVCSTPQMTFSCKIQHAFPIMKALVSDTLNSIPQSHNALAIRENIVIEVEKCVVKLVTAFLRKHGITKSDENKTHIKALANYAGLIFYKLYIYYNNYLTTNKADRKYFKNSLSFNSRHSNYELYMHLKTTIAAIFSLDPNDKDSAKKVSELIADLFVQDEILKEFIVPEAIRKGVFSTRNTLDIKNKNYGDPAYSLVSYFDFFEQPVTTDDNLDIDDNIVTYDWMEYKKLDGLSARLPLKDDVVLIECRFFNRLLSVYMYSIDDPELKKQMSEGICNELDIIFKPSLGKFSVRNLKLLLKYLRKQRLVKTPSRKTRSKKETPNKTMRARNSKSVDPEK